jgi:hypothetical protein
MKLLKESRNNSAFLLTELLNGLKGTDFEECVNTLNFDKAYEILLAQFPYKSEYVGNFTSALYKIGIDPLEYMSTIPNYFLHSNEDITNITTPARNLDSIGAMSFYHCKNLKTVSLTVSTIHTIEMGAFSSCTQLESVALPGSLQLIEDYAFEGCKNLTYIELPEGLKTIGAQAFSDCPSLQYIKVPKSVTSLGYNVFGNCSHSCRILVPKKFANRKK